MTIDGSAVCFRKAMHQSRIALSLTLGGGNPLLLGCNEDKPAGILRTYPDVVVDPCGSSGSNNR
jgi:hypothetical protein